MTAGPHSPVDSSTGNHIRPKADDNGKWAYVVNYDSGERIDSVLVADSVLSISGTVETIGSKKLVGAYSGHNHLTSASQLYTRQFTRSEFLGKLPHVISHSLMLLVADTRQHHILIKRQQIIVVCHTDDTGSENYTDRLSEARASAVYDYLLKNQLESVDLPGSMAVTDLSLFFLEALSPAADFPDNLSFRRPNMFCAPASGTEQVNRPTTRSKYM